MAVIECQHEELLIEREKLIGENTSLRRKLYSVLSENDKLYKRSNNDSSTSIDHSQIISGDILDTSSHSSSSADVPSHKQVKYEVDEPTKKKFINVLRPAHTSDDS